MTKPINENIRDVRIEDENGDLMPVLDVAGAKLSEVIAAIVATKEPKAISNSSQNCARLRRISVTPTTCAKAPC